MYKRHTLFIVLMICMLFAVPFSFGAEDFSASTSTSSPTFCTLSTQQDTITVTNTGDTTSQYQITASGRAAPYVVVVPTGLTLQPGQSHDVTLLYQFPKGKEGKYSLTLTFSTQTGLSKVIKKTLNPVLCNNNVLVAHNFNQTACPCLSMEYDFTVENTGNTLETYFFGLDQYADYANMSTNPLVLSPGQSEDITLTLDLACDIYGPQLLTFYSNAQASGIVSSVPILANIDRCYPYEINTGQIVAEPANNTRFRAHEDSYSVCAGDNSSLHIELDNTGYIGNNFDLSLTGPEWATLTSTEISLYGYESGYSFIDLSPHLDVEGDYRLVLKAEGQQGESAVEKVVELAVEDCHELTLTLPTEENICSCEVTEIPFILSNSGAFTEDIVIEVNGPEYVDFGHMNLTLNGSTQTVPSLIAHPNCDQSGSSTVDVSATLANGKASASGSFSLIATPVEQCYNVNVKPLRSLFVPYERTEIPIEVTHQGSVQNRFNVYVSTNEDWITMAGDAVVLAPGDTHTFSLITNPGNVTEGVYWATVAVETDDVIYERPLRLYLRSDSTLSEKVSSWFVYYRYWIITLLIALILLIVFIFLLVKRIRRWQTKRFVIKAIKKHQKETGQKPEPISFWKVMGIVLVVLLAIVLLSLVISPLYVLLQHLFMFIIEYILYIIVGLVLLIVLILILNYLEDK